MSGKRWYYGQNGDQFGPFTREKLQELAAAGILRSYDLVWCEGMTEWEPAERISALFPAPAFAASPTQRWRPPTGPPPSYGPPPTRLAPAHFDAPYHAKGPSHQGLAIAGLVGAFVMPIVGLILSWIALSNMKRDGNPEGRGVALAGAIISGITVGAFGLVMLAMCAGGAAAGL